MAHVMHRPMHRSSNSAESITQSSQQQINESLRGCETVIGQFISHVSEMNAALNASVLPRTNRAILTAMLLRMAILLFLIRRLRRCSINSRIHTTDVCAVVKQVTLYSLRCTLYPVSAFCRRLRGASPKGALVVQRLQSSLYGGLWGWAGPMIEF